MARRVTVVDDAVELLDVIGDVLREGGTEVVLLDRAATLREIEDSRPDLLIIDLRLGEDSLAGWDVIRLVRRHKSLRGVPIIVCSAAVDQIRAHGEDIASDRRTYPLPKPFSLDELEAVMRSAFTRTGG